MNLTDPYLVIGASGQQGTAVLAAIKRRGLRARALIRSEAESSAVMQAGATEFRIADFTDPAALAKACEETSAVFLITPFEADLDQALQTADQIAAGLATGGARHVIFNTGLIANIPPSGIGSVDGKLATLAALRNNGVPLVELAVTFYLENWLMPWASGRIGLEDVLSYPLSPNVPVSWLAHADMGEAAVAAMIRPELAGSTLQLGGVALTPSEMTTTIGQTIGRPLRFEELPLDAFIKGGDAASGPARMGTAIGALYSWAQSQPGAPADVTINALELLGVVPTPAKHWAAAQRWM